MIDENNWFTKKLWDETVYLYKECRRRGESIGRPKLSKLFKLTDSQARVIIFALENQEIIKSEPEAIFAIDKKELCIADLHIPYQDNLAIDCIIKYAIDYKPDIIVILGDLVDFYQISTFCKNPKKPSIDKELDEAYRFLRQLRNMFPSAEIIYKEGNHEFRLQRYLTEKVKELFNILEHLLEEQLKLKELNIKYITDPFKIGALWHLHGHEKPHGSGSVEYITNVLWKYIHQHFICGHYHREQEKIFNRIDNKTYWTGAVGYLAKGLDYAPLNNWTQGFAEIKYGSHGYFQANLRRIENGQIR